MLLAIINNFKNTALQNGSHSCESYLMFISQKAAFLQGI